jgi:hypothetical protein
VYQISTQVDIGDDRIVFSEGSVLQGIHRTVSGITSTTTGVLFSGTGVNMRFETLTLTATACSSLYSFNGSTTKVFSARDITASGLTGDIGTITDSLNSIFDFSVYLGGTGGITFSGANGASIIQTCFIGGGTGTGIAFGTSTFSGLRISGCTINGSIGLSGTTLSANINSGSKGYVTFCNFTGASTPLSTLDPDDIRWDFQENSAIQNSTTAAHGYVQTNVTTTTITVIDTPVDIDVNAAFAAYREHRFSVATDGTITYDGEDDITVHIVGTIKGTGASGTNTYTLYIGLNGSKIQATGIGREFSSTADGSITISGVIDLVTGDDITLMIENNSGTTDFNVKDAVITVN